MPHIMVTAKLGNPSHDEIIHRERINLADFESPHFLAQLLERLHWAVGDSHAAELAERSQKPARFASHAASRSSTTGP
jgi:hypothetical protein